MLRCLLDDLSVGCMKTLDERYVIIQRRGTVEQRQTLVPDTGGAIYIGKSCPGSLDQESQTRMFLK